jgi:hypothetical protein
LNPQPRNQNQNQNPEGGKMAYEEINNPETNPEPTAEITNLNPDPMTTDHEDKSRIKFTRKNLTIAYSKKGWTITECALRFKKSPQFLSGCLYAWEIPNTQGVTGMEKAGRGRDLKSDPKIAYNLYTGIEGGKPLTVASVARKLRVSRTTAYNYIKKEAKRRGETMRTQYEAQWLRKYGK